MTDTPQQLKALPAPLLAWYDGNRRRLPWREEVSAYRTWVSEIMLQQTRVTAVLPYFDRFMAAFPTVEALAAAPEAELMALWQGLGYYSRARNLQKAAQVIMTQYGGVFPDRYETLIRLPGVGDYTAGAIASIAFGQSVPAVDGNVLRLAARITGCDDNVLEPKTRAVFRRWMAEIMPPDRPGAFNQTLMDLGAMVCLPNGQPLCGDCPACGFCAAREQGLQRRLPVREKKSARRVEPRTVFLLHQGDAVAVRQRPDKGLLAGLWEFPNVPGTLTEQQAAAQLAQWGVTPHQWGKCFADKHVFTHITWEMTVFRLDVQGNGPHDWVWRRPEERQRCPMPTAFGKLENTEKDCDT